MTTIRVNGRFRGEVLMDELYAAFPEWLPQPGAAPQLRLETTAGELWLTLPPEADLDAVARVLQAHNPDAESQFEALRRRLNALAQGAVGKDVADLASADVAALLVLLLQRSGGLTSRGRVRPLGEWA